MPISRSPSAPRGERPLDLESRMILDRIAARVFDEEPPPARRIGPYEVVRWLGTGGMGEVYLVRNAALRRDEAVKVLRDSAGADVRVQARLLAEAHALARVAHPNVVHVYDADVAAEGVYIAMEYIEGPTLEAWQRAAPRPWREVLQAYAAAGRGLGAAHRAGLVHRDFKPSNVLLGAEDPRAEGEGLARRVRVIDFGLALSDTEEATHGEPPRTPLAGTPYYVSPEQIDERRPALSAASDQFSFCVALYEALYHRHPFFVFPAASRSTRTRTQKPAPADPVTLPARFAPLFAAIREAPLWEPQGARVPHRVLEVLRRGLERAPWRRYPSMEALISALERVLAPRRALHVAGGALGGALLGGIAVGWWLHERVVAPTVCEDPAAVIAEVWNPERATAVEAAFKRDPTDAEFAGEAFVAVDRALTRYAAEWGETLELACDATYVAATAGGDVYDRRWLCLEMRRDALAGAIRQLTEEPGAARRVDVVLAALPAVGDCGTTQAARCDDPAALDGFPGLRDALAAARGEERGGNVAAAVKRAAEAQAFAEAHGEPTLVAGAALLHGRLLADVGRWEGAQAALGAALAAADAAGCDDLAIDALNRLAKSTALDPSPRADFDWSPQVLARIERLYGAAPAGPQVRLRVLRRAEAINNRGLLRQRKSRDPKCDASKGPCARDLVGALADFEEALRLREAVEPSPLADLSATHRNLGAVLFALKRPEEALQRFERGLGLAAEAFGADNPAVWRAYFDEGKLLEELGRAEEAVPRLRTALRLVERSHAPDDVKVAEAHFQLASALFEVEDLDEALVHATAAVAGLATWPPATPRRRQAQRLLGELQYEGGQVAEALATREAVLAAVPAEELEGLMIAYLELAETRGALGDGTAQMRDADRALVLADILGVAEDDPLRGELLRFRGAALLRIGAPGGVAVLRQAEALLRKNLDEDMIDPAVWMHASWEVTRAICGPVPPDLEDRLADPEIAARPDIRRLAADVAGYDPKRCEPQT